MNLAQRLCHSQPMERWNVYVFNTLAPSRFSVGNTLETAAWFIIERRLVPVLSLYSVLEQIEETWLV